MLTRLIATVAALLLACASPQAQAHVRAERVSLSFADLARTAALENALPDKSTSNPKNPLPARATLENSAPGKNAAVTHWHVCKNWSPAPKCASGFPDYGYGNPGSYIDPDGRIAYLSDGEEYTGAVVSDYEQRIDQAVKEGAPGRAFFLGGGKGLAALGNKIVGGLNTTSNLLARNIYDGETYAQAEREIAANEAAVANAMEVAHRVGVVIKEDPTGAAVAVGSAALDYGSRLTAGDPRAYAGLGEFTGQLLVPGVGGKGLKVVGESVEAARVASRIDGNFIPASVADEIDLSSLPAAKAGKDPSMVETNKSTGDAARDVIAESRPGSVIEQNLRVTGGLRRVDTLDGTTAIESKVGRTSLTPEVRQELARDIKMLRSGKINVNAVEWHFTPSPTTGKRGPTGPLRAKLNKFGIPIVE